MWSETSRASSASRVFVVLWSAVLICGWAWADPKASVPYTEYVFDEVTLEPGATGSAIATCPAPSIVVGGGFSTTSSVLFFAQYKDANGWRGEARNNFYFGRVITVYAVCLHNAPGASVSQVWGVADVAPGTVGQAIAVCPAGSISTSGGFFGYSSGDLWISSSYQVPGEGWQTGALNVSGSNRTLYSYAVCVSGLEGTTRRVWDTMFVPAGETGYAFSSCNDDESLTGGGFVADDDLVIYASSGPHDGNQWRVFASNTHSSSYKKLSGQAICLLLRIFADGFESGDTNRWSASIP